LQIRARSGTRTLSALAAVRANDSRPTTITLGYGVDSAKGRSIYDRPPDAIFWVGLRSPTQKLLASIF
jgi:hypothetical protein